TELSIKRVLSRDGDSTYYINNIPVRRRDIHDLFLGTGLGPRAYAIIEQGMISRVVEAKPEELRIFLEEAAGVSKYKERRKETEARLADTRVNLSRVEDIRNELVSQLAKLEAQAQIAAQYRDFETRLKQGQHMLWFAKQLDAVRLREKHGTEIANLTGAFEAVQAELRAAENHVETLRAAQYRAGDDLHEKQGAFYAANAEVTRLEQQLQFARESEGRLSQQVAQVGELLSGLTGQIAALDAESREGERELEAAIVQRTRERSRGRACRPGRLAAGRSRRRSRGRRTRRGSAAADRHRAGDKGGRDAPRECGQDARGAGAAARATGCGSRVVGRAACRADCARRRAARAGSRRSRRSRGRARWPARRRSGVAGEPALRQRRMGAGEPDARGPRGTLRRARRAAGEDRARQGRRRMARGPAPRRRTAAVAATGHRTRLGRRAGGGASRAAQRARGRQARCCACLGRWRNLARPDRRVHRGSGDGGRPRRRRRRFTAGQGQACASGAHARARRLACRGALPRRSRSCARRSRCASHGRRVRYPRGSRCHRPGD
ncbi:MAG: hypothetical protein E6H53_12860, partial [Betaproteobacteria bacterium]